MSGVKRTCCWLMLCCIAFIVLLDQTSKSMAIAHLLHRGPFAVTSWLNMNLAFNTGAAFSLLSHGGFWSRYGLSLLALLIIIGVLLWWWNESSSSYLGSVAVALLVGGALGNLVDRVHYGMVVDFIDVHWGSAHFATFNVADSAVCVAVTLLLWRCWEKSCSKCEQSRLDEVKR